MTRRRNATKTPPEDREVYPATTYVGSIIAPKILMPVSVYANKKSSDRFRVFTPDRRYAVGAGYYGDEGPDGCMRQHMLPGLIDAADKGTGLGTALYIAGNMVVVAAIQNADGKFPWRLYGADNECTFSIEGDRSHDASRAWASLVRHGLAEEDEAEGGTEEISETYELDYFIDEDYVEQSAQERFEEEHPDATIHRSSADIRGDVTVDGETSSTVEANFMRWDTVKASGLVLHLGPYFDEPDDFEPVPPGAFARLNWDHTSDDMFVAFALANADGDEEDWLLEAACNIGGIGGLEDLDQRRTHLAQLLMAQLPSRKRTNPCPVKYAAASRRWLARYGSEYEENPRRRRIARRIANPF